MKTVSSLALLLFSTVFVAAAPPAEDVKARAARLLRSAIVVDTHEDVPEQLEKEWVDIGVRQKTGHVDIPRWREGGVTAPFLAAYVSSSYVAPGKAAGKALEFIDLIHRLVESHPKDLVFADSPAGIRAAKKAGRIAVLIGIEGGHAIEDSLAALSAFHRLGARYMTLTHTNTNDWADSSGSFFSLLLRPEEVRGAQRTDGIRPAGRARDEPAGNARGRLPRLRQDDRRRARGLHGPRLRFALLLPGPGRHAAEPDRRADPGDRREGRGRDDQLQLDLRGPEGRGRLQGEEGRPRAEGRRDPRSDSRTTRRRGTRRSRLFSRTRNAPERAGRPSWTTSSG